MAAAWRSWFLFMYHRLRVYSLFRVILRRSASRLLVPFKKWVWITLHCVSIANSCDVVSLTASAAELQYASGESQTEQEQRLLRELEIQRARTAGAEAELQALLKELQSHKGCQQREQLLLHQVQCCGSSLIPNALLLKSFTLSRLIASS
jgi:hypothetical protein